MSAFRFPCWLLLAFFPLFTACSLRFVRQVYRHPIPFQPEKYLCLRAENPPLLDGNPDEAVWEKTPWTAGFQDIEGSIKPAPALRTHVKMLWDDQYFYIAAWLEEPHLWATLTERDATMYQNDNFEVFIDPDGDGLEYYEFEMNANNAIWDLFMLRPYRAGIRPNYLTNWNIPGIRTAVALNGTLNQSADTDSCWTIEIAMPWEALKEMAPGRRPPKAGEQWRINFSRVDWWMDIQEGQYVKRPDPQTGKAGYFPQENWAWSPTGYVDMHLPEHWGYVQFASETGAEGFSERPDEQIKWALWQLFYQQQAFRKLHGRYSWYTGELTIPAVDLPGYTFAPVFRNSENQFELRAESADRKGIWHLNSEGRIWYAPQ